MYLYLFTSTAWKFICMCVELCTKIDIGVAPNTQLRKCVIKLVSFKGGHLMW